MSRKPIYDKENSKLRVVSMPNGLWQFQQLGGGKGTREHDPWLPMGPITDLQTALGHIKTER